MMKAFLKDRAGSTAIEYALLASFMALVLVAVLGVGSSANKAGVSGKLMQTFSKVQSSLK